MYRKCYRYDDLVPTRVEFRDEGAVIVNPDKPFGLMQSDFRSRGDSGNLVVDTVSVPMSKISLSSATPSPLAVDIEEQIEDQPLSQTESVKTAVSSIKNTFDGIREQIFKDGKIFGFLETDDLIIILVIVILLSEECEDYILLLALAAFVFLK